MIYTGSVGDLVISVGSIAYVIFYLIGLVYFVSRSIRAHTFLTIADITVSVVLAMAASIIAFLVFAPVFVE